MRTKQPRKAAGRDGRPAIRRDPVTHRLAGLCQRRGTLIAVALTLGATIRIVATYTVFNHTFDEPAHVACGMEWLDQGVYRWEPQHPPLARVAAALGPYLLGVRSQGTNRAARFAVFQEGSAILFHNHRYDLTLGVARAGILPFFWVACLVVYVWGKRYYGPAAAVVALFIFTFLQPILAHAGLATTDMALTAFMGGAFLTGLIWLEQPSPAHALLFGTATALMVLSKFSGLAFFPVSVALALAVYWYTERPAPGELLRAARQRAPSFALAVLAACLIIWAGYRFSFARFPAPELFAGIEQVLAHNAAGHDSYLLGVRGSTGFWPFYLVGLAVKTPLAVLVLLTFGIATMFRREARFPRLWIPLMFTGGILLVGMFSRINIGIRHVLPVYIGIALVAAVGALDLLQRGETRRWMHAALAALLLWLAAGSLLSHPDYLPYFNELAGSEPEKILADSDLDWGQDFKRLAHRLEEAGATDVAFDRYVVIDLAQLGFPRVHPLHRDAPSPGWNAIGVGLWKESRLVIWPDRIPAQERVGKSILLWYFPPGR